MEPVAAAVPAQPTEPISAPIETAVDQAVASGNVSAFREARAAAKAGTPLPVAPDAAGGDDDDDGAVTPPEAVAAPVRTVSKRQQQINDYERRIAEQAERITRLEAGQTAPVPQQVTPAAAVASAPAADPKPDPTDAAKYPDGRYDAQFTEDTAAWAARQEYARLSQAREQTEATTQAEQTRKATYDAFGARIEAAAKADAGFLAAITPAVLELETVERVRELKKPVTPLNVLATTFIEDEQGPQLMRHFSDHPDELARLNALKTPQAVFEAIGVLKHSLAPSGTPATPPTQTVTSAAPPPRTLGSKPAETADPITSAVANHDVVSFREERLRQRAAAQGRR